MPGVLEGGVAIGRTITSAGTHLLGLRFLLPGRDSRTMRHTVIGTFCSSCVNASTKGLPIATCVLHDVTRIAPLLLVQVVILRPIGLAFLDVASAGHGERRRAGGRT